MTVPEDFFTVHQADARALEELLRPHSSAQQPLLTCTITSPPYGDLKDYGHADQIGWGQSHLDYLDECERVFRSIHRHTRSDGSFWLIADTLRARGSRPSQLHPLPFQLAGRAQRVGWALREVIVWKKDRTLPWSSRGRLRNAFEYVLLLVKSDRFKFNIVDVRDPLELEEWWVKWPERYNPQGKVPTNVWEAGIPVQGSWSNSAVQHACPIPPELVERMILLSSDPGDVVFDPFAGSGVVIAEAERLGRRGLGTELVERHVQAFEEVVRPTLVTKGSNAASDRQQQVQWLQTTILRLRALKYPKVLIKALRKKHPALPAPSLALVITENEEPTSLIDPHKWIEARTLFVVDSTDEEQDVVRRAFKELAQQKPASKFGIDGDIDVITAASLIERVPDKQKLYLYRDGKTWWFDREVAASELPALLGSNSKFPLIVGNVDVREEPRRVSIGWAEQ